jgi:7-cyano-7-deazaguanine synthase in queuosine biosynthesis
MNICNIRIQETPGKIGVFCSGGADSSILLYALLKNTDSEITVFTLGNKEKKYKNIDIAKNVIAKCQELTNRNIDQHIIRNADVQTKQEIFNTEFLSYVDNGRLKILYTGFTSNPPQHVTESFKNKTEIEIRSPDIVKPFYHRDNTIYTPFANIDKTTIANMYTELDVMDSLFPVTRSCEWKESMGGDDPGLEHCGTCWWCEERLWAFNLGLN